MVSNNLLEFAQKAYGFDSETLHFISDSTNQIYQFQKDGKNYALRFSNRPPEGIHALNAEMDWLYFLAENKIGVSLPLKLENGAFATSTEDDGKHYILTAFEFVNGTFWNKNDPEKWNEKLFYHWGKVMGDIHRLTKRYQPANDQDVREKFDGKFALDVDNIKHCPTVEKVANDVIAEMMALPKDEDAYGLIHNDMHQWNFYVDGDAINVFDFDDALYGWFALDIGIALYHGLWWGRKDDAGNDFTNRIIENFLKGYLAANPLSDFWLSKIPLFMKFRQICKFSWFFDPKNIDEHQKERISNIEQGILFTDHTIDLTLFSNVNK